MYSGDQLQMACQWLGQYYTGNDLIWLQNFFIINWDELGMTLLCFRNTKTCHRLIMTRE